ncbi:hypothetical protein DSO57_1022691 [Entomophthora muscae]|uniref:Uncharacterized protein n=2 Tax=Entomophthora muscae TaxID=34485 RepID=A0ACC2TDX3_9FUNG|nr:hypothetical protein DSO57_1022691 [Entomophthora muscae]
MLEYIIFVFMLVGIMAAIPYMEPAHHTSSSQGFSPWSESVLRVIPLAWLQSIYLVFKYQIRISLYINGFYKRNLAQFWPLYKPSKGHEIEKHQEIIKKIKNADSIAFNAERANSFYETPVSFFLSILGPNLKYSCNLFSDDDLEQSEINMLELYCERAQIQDSMRILDAGCGWGGLSFYLCMKYPNSEIVAMTMSQEASSFMEKRKAELNIANLTIKCCDLTNAQFNKEEKFDRVLFIEVIEFMNNLKALFALASTWLKPPTLKFGPGKVLVHCFCRTQICPSFLKAPTESSISAKFVPSWLTTYMLSGNFKPGTYLFF